MDIKLSRDVNLSEHVRLSKNETVCLICYGSTIEANYILTLDTNAMKNAPLARVQQNIMKRCHCHEASKVLSSARAQRSPSF